MSAYINGVILSEIEGLRMTQEADKNVRPPIDETTMAQTGSHSLVNECAARIR